MPKFLHSGTSEQSLSEGGLSNAQSPVVRVSEDLASASICTDKYGIVLAKKDQSKFTPKEIEKLNEAVAAVDKHEVESKIDELITKNGSVTGPYTGEINKGLKEIVQARLEALVKSGVQNLHIASLSFAGTSLLDTKETIIKCQRLKDERARIMSQLSAAVTKHLLKELSKVEEEKGMADSDRDILSWRVLEAVNLEAKYNAILDGKASYPKRFIAHFSCDNGIFVGENDPVKETPIEE